MDLIPIDRLESALPEVLLSGRRQKVKLAEAARGEAIEQLTDETPPETVTLVRRKDGDGTDEGRGWIRFGPAAGDDLFAVARDKKRTPVIIDTGDGKLIRLEDRLDGRDVRGFRRGDEDVVHDER